MKENKRPKISFKTQLRLWTLAAGRCEFLGCNKEVWKDELTFTEANYSNIAHIISWTPSGPRGDKILSSKLATNISNLMLLCQKHAKLIDIKEQLSRYTVDVLRQCKKIHEDRVRMQTSIQSERQTTVIRLQSNIRGRRVEVPQTDIYNALLENKRYPADDKGILIDLTNLDYSRNKSIWATATQQIKHQIDRYLTPGNDGSRIKHMSIFGLAPIPILVYFGYVLGNTIVADIYIKLRDRWVLNNKPKGIKFFINKKWIKKSADRVALSIAITGSTLLSDIKRIIGKNNPIYEIRVAKPGVDLIQSAFDLEIFRQNYRKLIDEI